MDENLLKTSREKPFYITEESKKVLTDAIQNDTAFLEANSMMDYSLFVAIDGAELVLGSVSKLVALNLLSRQRFFRQLQVKCCQNSELEECFD